MALNGPLVCVEDDADDTELFLTVMNELEVPNKIITFKNCKEAMEYLYETREQPFLIVCDVNLPGQSGIDFKYQIDQNAFLRRKSIPFIFYSTSISQEGVNRAYTQMTVQGFFLKKNSYKEILSQWQTIIAYWQHCKHPNI